MAVQIPELSKKKNKCYSLPLHWHTRWDCQMYDTFCSAIVWNPLNTSSVDIKTRRWFVTGLLTEGKQFLLNIQNRLCRIALHKVNGLHALDTNIHGLQTRLYRIITPITNLSRLNRRRRTIFYRKDLTGRLFGFSFKTCRLSIVRTRWNRESVLFYLTLTKSHIANKISVEGMRTSIKEEARQLNNSYLSRPFG